MSGKFLELRKSIASDVTATELDGNDTKGIQVFSSSIFILNNDYFGTDFFSKYLNSYEYSFIESLCLR